MQVTPTLERKLKDATGTKMNWQALVRHSFRLAHPTHAPPRYIPLKPHPFQTHQAIFVGVPLPGTGAWTGAALAALFKLSYAESFLGVVAGILSAGAIMTAVVLAGACVGSVMVEGGWFDGVWVRRVRRGLSTPPSRQFTQGCGAAWQWASCCWPVWCSSSSGSGGAAARARKGQAGETRIWIGCFCGGVSAPTI